MLEKIEDFLNYLEVEKGSPRNTLIAYRNDLTQLAEFLDEDDSIEVESWDEVDKDMIVAYILHLKEREYAASTVARKVAATKSFFHFLVGEELTDDDPTATLDSPKVKKQLPKAIPVEEVERLLAEPTGLLFFYAQDCERCQAVIDEVLSPLQRKYEAQLEVQSVEISDADNCKWLLDMQATYQVPPDKVGIPEVFVGDTALIGEAEIRAQLDETIAKCLTPKEPTGLLFFYAQDCKRCQAVIDEVLSPLQRKYEAQLEVQSVEISDADNCKWLLDMQATYQVPPDKVGIPEVFVGDTALIGEAEIRAQLDETIAKCLTPKALRDKAMLELLYATGMRATELVELDLYDINLPSNSVRVVGKGDKERIIPVHSRAIEAIEAYLRKGRVQFLKDTEEKALFLNPRGGRLTRQGLWLIVKDYVERAGLDPDITPHTLRHSFATHMLESNEATLVDVQQFLGHANISTTQIYTRVTSKHKRLVYDKSHPRAK